ncbi:MAG: hypothetical protein DI585_03145 [Pseudomonas fluorescens]|nr:MAG: hypothetical protein DI585_03145 [Pseudomonas fluorescens]
MRQGFSFGIWKLVSGDHAALASNGLCGGRSLTALLVALAFAAALGGCSTNSAERSTANIGREALPVDETGPWTNREPTQRELVLSRSDFSVEIVRFTDARRPRSMELESDDQMIHTYDPDNLLGGVSYQVPGILGKYLSYRPKQMKHYKVEIDVKSLNTQIKTGKLWSGSWGRYSVTTELNVLVRRPDSTVVFNRVYRYEQEQARKDYNGRGPTKERDRARMFDLTESVLRKAAEDIAWDIRQRDARRWRVNAPQSIPTRLNLPPVDRASGTPENNYAPMPSTVPAKPVDMWIDVPVTVPGEVRDGAVETTPNVGRGSNLNAYPDVTSEPETTPQYNPKEDEAPDELLPDDVGNTII